jgi:hypothetical protein
MDNKFMLKNMKSNKHVHTSLAELSACGDPPPPPHDMHMH